MKQHLVGISVMHKGKVVGSRAESLFWMAYSDLREVLGSSRREVRPAWGATRVPAAVGIGSGVLV